MNDEMAREAILPSLHLSIICLHTLADPAKPVYLKASG
jgi:hypothetical protein